MIASRKPLSMSHGQPARAAQRGIRQSHLADIRTRSKHVRFTPKSGHAFAFCPHKGRDIPLDFSCKGSMRGGDGQTD